MLRLFFASLHRIRMKKNIQNWYHINMCPIIHSDIILFLAGALLYWLIQWQMRSCISIQYAKSSKVSVKFSKFWVASGLWITREHIQAHTASRSNLESQLCAIKMQSLGDFSDKQVLVVTFDGKVVKVINFFCVLLVQFCWYFQGTLTAYDRQCNIALSDCVERVFPQNISLSADENSDLNDDDCVQLQELGLYLIKAPSV